MFELDSRLRGNCERIGSLKLSELLLMNDSNYPWLILVPRVQGVTELIDFSSEEQRQLLAEINIASKVLRSVFEPEKINVATLGNLVPQFHMHCIGRFSNDVAWPGPVWGKVEPRPYRPALMRQTTMDIIEAIKTQDVEPFEPLAP